MSVSRVLVFIALLSISTACLITNCPKGGKRAFPLFRRTELSKDIRSQCVKCGPNLNGRCVSSTICCSPNLGCVMATPDVLSQCQPLLGIPRQPSAMFGQSCTINNEIGSCVSKSICCSEDSCKLEQTCDVDELADVCGVAKFASAY